ncbi:MAG: thioredoxin [Eubacteriales bacterium]
MAEVITLTGQNFDSIVGADKPVLVDFWASWCGPCRMVSPTVDEIAAQSDGSFSVGKVNVDDEGELAARWGVMSIPTLMVFKSGEVLSKAVGVRGKDDILKMLGK